MLDPIQTAKLRSFIFFAFKGGRRIRPHKQIRSLRTSKMVGLLHPYTEAVSGLLQPTKAVVTCKT